MILKIDYEKSRSGLTLAKEAGFEDKSKCAFHIKINLWFYQD